MLPESRGWDATVVGGQCAKSIRRIHLAINRLATMGDDELRTLWVEVRGKRLEWYRLSGSVSLSVSEASSLKPVDLR